MNRELLVISEPEELRRYAEACRAEALRDGVGPRQAIGLVPTMGALHDGHLQLVRRAVERARSAIVTIFVNPTQFGPNEDFASYPRDLEADLDKCRAEGVSVVFAPEAALMYAEHEQTRVSIGALGNGLCGAARPGHFTGVCTIVSKLFSIVGPCTAVFGQKDYQQFKIIERMARDLFLPVDVLGYPTVREPDGLAMSSRNRRLSAEMRAAATAIPRALELSERLFAAGERSVERLREQCTQVLLTTGLKIDYVELVDAEHLTSVSETFLAEESGQTLMALAVFAGTTRLIDNCLLGAGPRPRVAS